MTTDTKSRPHSLNILLLGKEGSGKSSLGNALLGRRAFEVSAGMMRGDSGDFRASSNENVSETGGGGWPLTVVDSPDLMSGAPASHNERIPVIRKSLEEACKRFCPEYGFHMVLLTVRLDMRFTVEHRLCMSCISEAVGVEALARAGIVVFTHGDCVNSDEAKFQELVQSIRQQGDASGMGSLIDCCGGRFCMIDGSRKCESTVQLSQVQKLMKMIDAANIQPVKWPETKVVPGRNGGRYVRLGVAIAVAVILLGGFGLGACGLGGIKVIYSFISNLQRMSAVLLNDESIWWNSLWNWDWSWN